jgi:hypothetical protein
MRLHVVAFGLAAVAALGVVLEGAGAPCFRERLIGATVLALCHGIAGSQLLPAERLLRERARALGPGADATLDLRRFDVVHRVYVALEIAAIAIGVALVTSAVLAR